MTKPNKPLTKAEEQLMQILWDLDKAFLKDILNAYPDPKPKQSTVSTVLKLLEEKGYVDHHVFGKIHQYFPLVPKGEYARDQFGGFLKKYFDGSFSNMLNFFYQKGDLDIHELDKILTQIQEHENSKE